MSFRRGAAVLWIIAAGLGMLASWASWIGPYRWAAEWQQAQFGSYNPKLTLLLPMILLALPAGFIGGWGPLMPVPAAPADQIKGARRGALVTAVLGGLALAIGAAAGGLGYQRMQTPLTSAALVLKTGAEPVPSADLVTISAVARTDLIVTFEETSGGATRRWSFVPLVAPDWRAGEPIRFLLRTNQTAWIPKEGVTGGVRMFRPGQAPFPMVTEPSVLDRLSLPGIVTSEYQRMRVTLAGDARVARQSASEVYAPYWMAAAGGGLLGLACLAASVIMRVSARRAARKAVAPEVSPRS